MSWEEVKKINSDFTKPLNELISTKSIIKSIQRGNTQSVNSEITISISPIDPLKSIVIVQNTISSYSNSGYPAVTYAAAPKSLQSTSVTFTSNRTLDVAFLFNWQIIEFY